MKKVFTSKIYYLFFVFLFLVGILLIKPVSNSFKSFSNSITNKVSTYLEENFGISVNYQSLSPSLLTQLSIKKIEVTNQDDELVGNINSIKVKYRLFKILKGDIQNGITSVTFEGARIDISKVLSIFVKNAKSKDEKELDYDKQTKNKTIKSIHDVRKLLPNKCFFNNFSFYYEDENCLGTLNLNKIALNTNEVTDNLSVDFLSNLNVKFKKVLNGLEISSDIEYSANVNSTFDNAHMYLTFSNITDGNYKINKLNFFADYNEQLLSLRTVKSVFPFEIDCKYNNVSKKIDFSLITQKFNLFDLLSTNDNKSRFEKYKNLSFTSKTFFNFDLIEKKMNYSLNGDLVVPPEAFLEGFDLSYSLNGNEKEFVLDFFEVNGKNCEGNINLVCNIPKLQLSGGIYIPFVRLPNGTEISTEVFFDPLDEGFIAFSPQIYFGENSLTALQFSLMPQKQNKTYDYYFEVSDYSHYEEDQPGVLSFNGSYLKESKYVQTNLNINSLFADGILNIISSLMAKEKSEKLQSISSTIKPYMFSGDLYFSSDFKTFSYNVPYILAANTKKENQAVMISFNGNNESVQLDNVSFIMNKIAVEASGMLEFSNNYKDFLFSLDLLNEAIPYNFYGSKTNDSISVYGDYDFYASVDLSKIAKQNQIEANLSFYKLPFSFGDGAVFLSSNLLFSFDEKNGPYMNVLNFEAELNSPKINFIPKLQLDANITKYGAQINSLTYSDSYSLMEGFSTVLINSNQNNLESVGVQLSLKNALNNEAITMEANFSNPELKSFSMQNILESLYMDVQIKIANINLNRISKIKHENNQITASVFATGPINNPYLVMNIENMTMRSPNDFMDVKGIVSLEDKRVTVNDFMVEFSRKKLENIKLDFDLNTFDLAAQAKFIGTVAGLDIQIPIYFDISEVLLPKGGFIPKSCKIDLQVKDTYGLFTLKPINAHLTGLYSEGNVVIFSPLSDGVYGNYSKDGALDFTLNLEDLIKANVTGSVTKNNLNVKVSDLSANLKNIFAYFNLNRLLIVENGQLEGSLNISGELLNPYLLGALKISKPKVKTPMFCNDSISTETILATVNKDEIKIIPNVYKVKNKEKIKADCTVFLNKWSLDHIEANIATLSQEYVKGGLFVPEFSVLGDVKFDLDLYFENFILDVTGDLFGEDIEFSSSMTKVTGIALTPIQKQIKLKTRVKVISDLNINLGTHAIFNFDPLLRCVLEPNTSLRVLADQITEDYKVLGNVNVRSGDIAYLNRNFYIKEGNVVFNSEDLMNPQITITAETREKDQKGNNVRIILNAENQYLQTLEPKVSSIPAKSEVELRAILGDIVMADSETAANFLLAAGDYAIQSAIFRKAENKLRDFMNFDILSLRTNILQNSISRVTTRKVSNELTMATLLDNTTLYIGKYLTNSIYFDAMLHVSLDNRFSSELAGVGGLLFQPQIGIELESPFVNVRWNMAPDINALLRNQFVPSTSVTLSWEFAF